MASKGNRSGSNAILQASRAEMAGLIKNSPFSGLFNFNGNDRYAVRARRTTDASGRVSETGYEIVNPRSGGSITVRTRTTVVSGTGRSARGTSTRTREFTNSRDAVSFVEGRLRASGATPTK